MTTPAESLTASMQIPLRYADILRLAQAYLADPAYGDVTPELFLGWLEVAQLDPFEIDALAEAVQALRVQHFAGLGQTPPTYPEPAI